MLDMGDFAGGMLKYLDRHPIERVTIGGGIGKIAKLAQGAVDLHSSRSQVDLALLADQIDDPRIAKAETALHALQIAGEPLAINVAVRARTRVTELLKGSAKYVDVILVDRNGKILTRASQ